MTTFAMQIYVRLTAAERGQTMAEYAIVLAVISIGIVTALGLLSTSIKTALSKVTADI